MVLPYVVGGVGVDRAEVHRTSRPGVVERHPDVGCRCPEQPGQLLDHGVLDVAGNQLPIDDDAGRELAPDDDGTCAVDDRTARRGKKSEPHEHVLCIGPVLGALCHLHIPQANTQNGQHADEEHADHAETPTFLHSAPSRSRSEPNRRVIKGNTAKPSNTS